MEDVPTVLGSLRLEIDEDLQPVFFELEDLYERRLWHQLTLSLVSLFRDPRSASVRMPLFTRVIARLQDFVQKLAYVSLAITASEQCPTPQEALDFLKPIVAKVDTDDTRDVHVYAQLRIAALLLQLHDQPAAKKIIDWATKLVDELPISDPAITACFYGTACEYFKVRREYTSYYRNALLYLACINLDDLSPETQQQKAYDLCVAALLGDKIYNFGELILHPVLTKLDDTEYKWLSQLIHAVNAGDIAGFQALRPQLQSAPLLHSALPFLEQKICLMALCECVFRRPPTDRTLTFQAIARETHLQAGARVEVLVIKAFSIGLLKGTIDQVAQTVTVTWLQPRILSREQMVTTRKNLQVWDHEVEELGKRIYEQGKDVWSVA